MKVYYFYGVSIDKNRMIGYINSGELISGMDESWIPDYQRDRIQKTRKINSLIDIFKNNAAIDSIKLCLHGKVDLNQATNEALLDGRFHIIDGQQRMWALKDSGVRSYRMPVELYVNLAQDDEIKLFHQFNTEGTRLTFGELVKSYTGPMADMVRKILKTKVYPVKLSINNPKLGLTLNTYSCVLYWAHRKLIRHQVIKSVHSGRRLKYFMQDVSYSRKELQDIEFATRNLFAKYVEIFGTYDVRSLAFKRVFMLSVLHVWIDNFMQNDGTLHFIKFKTKNALLPQLIKTSYVRELIENSSGHEAVNRMYDVVIEHFNHKLKTERLQTLVERHGYLHEEEELDDGSDDSITSEGGETIRL